MSGLDLVEQPDRWTLTLQDAEVTRCSFDYAVTLSIYSSAGYLEIRIEQQLELTLPTRPAEVVLVPEQGTAGQMAPALDLLHTVPLRVEAFKDGRLVVLLAGDGLLRVQPDDAYEAWTLTGPDDLRLVSIPGGDLAVWSPVSGQGAAGGSPPGGQAPTALNPPST